MNQEMAAQRSKKAYGMRSNPILKILEFHTQNTHQ